MRNKIITLILTVFLVLCLSGCCSGTFEGSKDYTKRTGGKLQPTMMQDLSSENVKPGTLVPRI